MGVRPGIWQLLIWSAAFADNLAYCRAFKAQEIGYLELSIHIQLESIEGDPVSF
jgi:hypothetical protein